MNRSCFWVFFDFDGTLLNSIFALYEGYCSFLEIYGCKGTKKEFTMLNGPSLVEIVRILKQRHNVQDSEGEMLAQYVQCVDNVYSHAQPMQNAEFVLDALLSLHCSLLLVSSAKKDLLFSSIQRLRWEQYFLQVISGDDVVFAKPDPQIYRSALDYAKVGADQVIVVEDSVNGVISAVKNGLCVVGINEKCRHNDLLGAGARWVVSDLKEVPLIVKGIIDERRERV